MDLAIRGSAKFLSRRQRKDGSWSGDAGATALALQALAAVESPTAAVSVEKGLRFLFDPAKVSGANASYAVAYALAAAHRRPRMNDESGLLSHGERLREFFTEARHLNCEDFRRAVLMSALGAAGTPKEELAAVLIGGTGAPACAAFIPEPKSVLIRGLFHEIVSRKFTPSGGLRVKPLFDAVIFNEERLSLDPSGPSESGPLGLDGLLWAAVSLTEMRGGMVEPKRGCFFSADLLASRILRLRGKDGAWRVSGYSGADFGTASALLALIHLRNVVVEAVPLPR